MRKIKDLNSNEKFLLIIAILLLIAILFKWPQVKDGFKKGFEKYGFNNIFNKNN